MSIAGKNGRRSRLVLMAAVALTSLLATTGGAAYGEGRAGSDPGTAARTDVFMHDVAADVGTEPHGLNPLWASPDIKVCPTAVECATSQNPIVGATNYLFVKLWNNGPYGSGVDSGTLRIYRTTPGGGAIWPTSWTPIGAASVTVFPGVTTVTIPWTGVPGPGHFCLLARWVSGTDPMTFEGPDISTNTRYNNNIAWRNVNSVRLSPGSAPVTRPFAIGNPLDTAIRSNLVVTQPAGKFQAAGGRMAVDLGPVLFERWRAGGMAGNGIREIGQNQVEIVDPLRASIDNLLLNPGERIEFALTFAAEAPSSDQFEVNVAQFGPNALGEANADLGGVQYQITVDQQ